MGKHLLVPACVALLLSSSMAAAQDRCPASNNDCTLDDAFDRIKDRIDEGARKVWNNENPEGRVNEVRRTLNDCSECGWNAIRNGMDRITNPNDSGSSGSSSDGSSESSSGSTSPDDSGGMTTTSNTEPEPEPDPNLK